MLKTEQDRWLKSENTMKQTHAEEIKLLKEAHSKEIASLKSDSSKKRIIPLFSSSSKSKESFIGDSSDDHSSKKAVKNQATRELSDTDVKSSPATVYCDNSVRSEMVLMSVKQVNALREELSHVTEVAAKAVHALVEAHSSNKIQKKIVNPVPQRQSSIHPTVNH